VSDVGLNAFEADVRDALELKGIRTRPQFGASRYRIDLVAMHPKKPGRPVLAIECDGASYHSSATARDRDRLRQAHLQRLGWRFHRIWSTDCVFRRNPATIPRPNRPLFRRESGHHSEGNSAGVPSRFRPLFLGGSELIWTVPD